MQRLLRTLQEHGLLTPVRIILLFLVVLSIIIILGQFFHQSLQDAMAEQFNKQQLLLAQQVAINVEGFLDHVYKDINVISRLPDILSVRWSPQARSVMQGIHYHVESDILVALRVIDRAGVILYDSGYPSREGTNIADTKYFRRATTLKRNQHLVTDLMDVTGDRSDPKQFVMAVPIYQKSAGSEETVFRGVVMAVLSVNGITQKYLLPVKSGTRGYA